MIRLVGWLGCCEDDGEGRFEAGCNLDLMKGGANGCFCVYRAGSGADWFRVWLLGRK